MELYEEVKKLINNIYRIRSGILPKITKKFTLDENLCVFINHFRVFTTITVIQNGNEYRLTEKKLMDIDEKTLSRIRLTLEEFLINYI
ncbi:MAG: hypothetical protein H7836_08120 [Magnetococcus sp. YQC-3]